jgi:RNA polymerase sigma-70 factor (ECF subfamily)
MDLQPAPPTSPTLLGGLRLNPADPLAWEAFVRRYGPCLHAWCRRWHLSESDAEDVTQNVMLKLVSVLPSFTYDPSRRFRGWLKTLAHHAWRDYLESQRRPGQGSGDSAILKALDNVAAGDDLVQRLANNYDQELLELAVARVRLRVAPHTWEAFQLMAVEGLPAAEVAQRVGMQTAMVYVAKKKVKDMLAEEIRKLEDDP